MTSKKNLFPERIDKALNWLGISRDSWKGKAKTAKEELKKRTLAAKRARESRDEYKQRFEEAEEARYVNQEELNQKTIDIERLEKQLTEARSEIEELKKKLWNL
jgi:chromosome segregation ATPase